MDPENLLPDNTSWELWDLAWDLAQDFTNVSFPVKPSGLLS